MGTKSLAYTWAIMEEVARIASEPSIYNSYLANPQTGIVLSAGVDNKIVLSSTTLGDVRGFDLYVTPQGSALRFVGSGLGNGDVASFEIRGHAGLKTGASAASVDVKVKTRPYTEADFANAVQIPGLQVAQKLAVNATENIPIVAPEVITVNDGDLLELAINPDTGVTLDLDQFSFTAVEVYRRV